MIKAVIFDMDGLMIETEHLQSISYEEVIKEYGKKPIINENGIVHPVGITARNIWKLLKDKYSIKEDVEILLSKKQKKYIEILKEQIIAKKGLLKLIKILKAHNIKMAVASSSVLEHIKLIVSKLGVRQYFSVLISSEDLKRGKPYPDIFLKAAQNLDVKPSKCLVLEDAEPGVIAGKRANMKVIAVPNQYTKSHNLSKADLIVDSLEDIKWSTISKI